MANKYIVKFLYASFEFANQNKMKEAINQLTHCTNLLNSIQHEGQEKIDAKKKTETEISFAILYDPSNKPNINSTEELLPYLLACIKQYAEITEDNKAEYQSTLELLTITLKNNVKETNSHFHLFLSELYFQLFKNNLTINLNLNGKKNFYENYKKIFHNTIDILQQLNIYCDSAKKRLHDITEKLSESNTEIMEYLARYFRTPVTENSSVLFNKMLENYTEDLLNKKIAVKNKQNQNEILPPNELLLHNHLVSAIFYLELTNREIELEKSFGDINFIKPYNKSENKKRQLHEKEKKVVQPEPKKSSASINSTLFQDATSGQENNTVTIQQSPNTTKGI